VFEGAQAALEGSPLAERRADPAMALAKRFGVEFGLKDTVCELTEMQAHRFDDGRLRVCYQQVYEGIPVMGGELIVHTNQEGGLYSLNGEIGRDLSLPTEPAIQAEEAQRSARGTTAKWYHAAPTNMESFSCVTLAPTLGRSIYTRWMEQIWQVGRKEQRGR
jgi:Zn-dependent metalloprotease